VEHELRFECQAGCTDCCTRPGFVYVNQADIDRAAAFVGISPDEFERRYIYRTRRKIRLRRPRRLYCYFLADGRCGIHAVKPVQCRTYPFWPELIESKREWRRQARVCPGIGKGPLVNIQMAKQSAQEIREGLPELYADK